MVFAFVRISSPPAPAAVQRTAHGCIAIVRYWNQSCKTVDRAGNMRNRHTHPAGSVMYLAPKSGESFDTHLLNGEPFGNIPLALQEAFDSWVKFFVDLRWV